MRFVEVRLAANADCLPNLAAFYGDALGIEIDAAVDRLAFALGETTVELVGGAGAAFYHFALLVPGDRFDVAFDWASERTQLLPDPESAELVFDFENWNARACYFADPAGNIVELIAHAGREETGARGAFSPAELVGFSELGLVGDAAAMAAALDEHLGLPLWSGTVDEPGRLAFVGEKARTLILSPPSRGWLPTGRPAEPHPIELVLATGSPGGLELENRRYRITTTG